jgi:hypothetical protein
MLSNVRNLFEKLTEPDAEDNKLEKTSNPIISSEEEVMIKEEMDKEDGWQLVHDKRIKTKKEITEEITTSKTYVLSELIQNDVCIHCMSGKCREG